MSLRDHVRLRRARASLQRSLDQVGACRLDPPQRGWVWTIREALGLTERGLGKRMGIHQSSVSRLQQRETEGSITLRSLQEVADALDCELQYCLIPRQPLEEIVRGAARRKARADLVHVNKSMALEGQEIEAGGDDVEELAMRLIEVGQVWS